MKARIAPLLNHKVILEARAACPAHPRVRELDDQRRARRDCRDPVEDCVCEAAVGEHGRAGVLGADAERVWGPAALPGERARGALCDWGRGVHLKCRGSRRCDARADEW